MSQERKFVWIQIAPADATKGAYNLLSFGQSVGMAQLIVEQEEVKVRLNSLGAILKAELRSAREEAIAYPFDPPGLSSGEEVEGQQDESDGNEKVPAG